MDRHAEPDPWRAMRDRSDCETPCASRSYRRARVAIRADRPEADDARPAAVGKLFSEAMWSGYDESWGRDESSACGRARERGASARQRIALNVDDV